jgi:hypothetical protein
MISAFANTPYRMLVCVLANNAVAKTLENLQHSTQCSPESQSHTLTENTSLTKCLNISCYKADLNPGSRFSFICSNFRVNDLTKRVPFYHN